MDIQAMLARPNSEWTFHPTLVEPFYSHLMNANILSESRPIEERAKILAAFCKMANTVSDQQLNEMLKSTWRPAKVAAWAIAYGKRTQFTDEVCQQLLARPNYAEHLCICLARLGGESAYGTLLTYIKICGSNNVRSSLDKDVLSPDYALAALEYLNKDEENKPIISAVWNDFLNTQNSNRLTSRLFWENRRNDNKILFSKVMQLFDSGLRFTSSQ